GLPRRRRRLEAGVPGVDAGLVDAQHRLCVRSPHRPDPHPHSRACLDISRIRVARWVETRQPRRMSKQAGLTLTDVSTGAACCQPISEQQVSPETAAVLAPAFKALGDPVRLQLMSMIASAPAGEICVCELTPAFTLSGPTISHHLKTLRDAGLV